MTIMKFTSTAESVSGVKLWLNKIGQNACVDLLTPPAKPLVVFKAKL